MPLVLLMLIFSPAFSVHSSTAAVLSWMSLNSLDISAISSANSRSSNFLINFHLIPVHLCTLFLITQSSTKRERNPDIPQLCFTTLSILTQSDCSPLFVTHISLFWYIFFIIVNIFGGTPYTSIILHNVYLWMLSNAFFFKSMKFKYNGACHWILCLMMLRRMKIWSDVPIPCRNLFFP